MRFLTLRSTVAPSLLLLAAGCGSVRENNDDAGPGDAGGSADAMPDAPPAGFPINATSAGTVDENGTLDLMGRLVTADMDNTASQLTYTLRSLPVDGSIRLDGTPLAVGATFTQQDVNDSKVTYVHNGAENPADGFAWDLTDGEHQIPATGTINFAITVNNINDAPTIVNNPVTTLAEGSSEVLTPARLMAADAEGSPLTFTLLAQTRGALQKKVGNSFTNLAINGTFTQQDIVDGNMRFVDPGTDDANLAAQNNTTASFSWSVADPDGGVNPAVGSNITNFTITPVDDPVAFTWKPSLCFGVGATAPANPLQAISDPDTPMSQYQICIVALTPGKGTNGTTEDANLTPQIRNGATNMTVNSCAPALTTTNITATAGFANYPANVPVITWRLLKNGTQVGTNNVVSLPACP